MLNTLGVCPKPKNLSVANENRVQKTLKLRQAIKIEYKLAKTPDSSRSRKKLFLEVGFESARYSVSQNHLKTLYAYSSHSMDSLFHYSFYLTVEQIYFWKLIHSEKVQELWSKIDSGRKTRIYIFGYP